MINLSFGNFDFISWDMIQHNNISELQNWQCMLHFIEALKYYLVFLLDQYYKITSQDRFIHHSQCFLCAKHYGHKNNEDTVHAFRNISPSRGEKHTKKNRLQRANLSRAGYQEHRDGRWRQGSICGTLGLDVKTHTVVARGF